MKNINVYQNFNNEVFYDKMVKFYNTFLGMIN